MTITKPFREKLRTVQLVPVTAYDAAGEVALAPTKQLISRLREAGVRVFIPCAGSAEFDCLDHEEIFPVLNAVREAAGGEAVVMAPVARQLRSALAFARRVPREGADCLLIMPLQHSYLSNVGARDYYRAILDASPVPVLVYKKSEIPSDELLLELAEHPNLVGVKYAVNDMDAFQRVVQADAGRIDWYCGSAERFAPYFMLAGAPGYTSGAGNVCPRLTLAMHAAVQKGNWPAAMELQRKIRPIEDYRSRAGASYNITFLKYALRHVGLDFGPPRAPNRQLTATEMKEIDHMMPAILDAERSV